MDPIHLFVPKFRVAECLAEIEECLEKGWTGLGFKTVDIEENWMRYTQLPYAHFVNSATSGLHLAVQLLKHQNKWDDNDEVISTPLTFVSTNHAILYAGLTPVFADIDEHLCLSPESIREKISDRTRAVMFVGQGGNTGQLEEVERICQQNDLKLILDAAHMAGSYVNDEHVGKNADATVFSFQAVKNLPTADAGMICFKDGALDDEVRKWTWLGIDKDTYSRTHDDGKYKWHYNVDNVGYKYHGNSVMAALALVGLRYLDQDNDYRRLLSQRYYDFLGGISKIETISVPENCKSSSHLYQVLVDKREEVMLKLNALDIFPGVHYRDNCHYPMYQHMTGTCPRAQFCSEHLISLPLHLNMKEADVDRVSEALMSIVN